MAPEAAEEIKSILPRMRSVERISKLPAVEQTVDLANNLYVKVKDSNSLVKSVLTTAETTVKGAVDMTFPVTTKLEGPIRKVDSWLCTSLDYVENKIPAVKLPLEEMVKNTRASLYTIPGVKCACQAGENGVKKAVEIAYGASQYGTQKLKDVKDILTLPPQNSEAHFFFFGDFITVDTKSLSGMTPIAQPISLHRVVVILENTRREGAVAKDSKNSFAAQYSLTAKRLLSLLISWLWIAKPHIPDRRPLSSVGENALNDKKESEAQSKGLSSAAISSGLFLGREVKQAIRTLSTWPNHRSTNLSGRIINGST